MDNYEKIQEAKAFLKQNGYYTDNLWHVSDVKARFECSDDEAQKVLHDALKNDATMEQINFAIGVSADVENLPKYIENLFLINGFYKDDKTKFSDFLVYTYDCAPEDEDINDEDIFFYGLSEEQIISAIKSGENTDLDFVITSYEKATI